MSLDKLVKLYSIDTNDLFIDKESKLYKIISRASYIRKKLQSKMKTVDDTLVTEKRLLSLNSRLKRLKEQLSIEIESNQDQIRSLSDSKVGAHKEITVFDSVLTRTIGMDLFSNNYSLVNNHLIVVQTYHFSILKSIIQHGFIFQGNKYIYFTASAGQIRTKKTIFIRADVIHEHRNSLTCGLLPEKINSLGGVNINKYLAYLALCNTATDQWDFDIKKTIVVDDMELNLLCEVDYINDHTFEINRCNKSININFTDGCGMILPKVKKNSFMIRLPWVKGLMVPFPFDKFIKKNNGNPIIKDIYGHEHHILKDDIQMIFTKSQFKMWKYYSSWSEYIELFQKHNCQIGICNQEEEEFQDKRLNYQILQTLTDITDEEINQLTNSTNVRIEKMSSDRNTMLETFGVRKNRKSMNYFQKSLQLYPELLQDSYTKHILQQMKRKKVIEGRSGKIDVQCKYAFVCPDLYAFCEYLFLGEKQPSGIIKNGEVSFSEYAHQTKLDCLRSPHLYREHAVRNNIQNENTKQWFITKGIYVSIHDPISKLLMFDHDGDTLLIVADQTLVQVAERNMHGIVPLYYDMKNANDHFISSDMVYEGLTAAYTGGNIGVISNDISKVWNSDTINLDVIKWKCMLNNFTIDYAKTLYKPTIPLEHKKIISSYMKTKLPYFFMFAKDKGMEDVGLPNNSTMNKISKAIVNKRMNFRKINVETFDCRLLLHNMNTTDTNQEVCDFYKMLDQENARNGVLSVQEGYSGNYVSEYLVIRDKIEKQFSSAFSIHQIVDFLIYHLFIEKNSKFKKTFWSSFGDIVFENLQKNLNTLEISNMIVCDLCGKRTEKKSNRTKFCDECREHNKRELWRENKRKSREHLKSVQL